MADSSRVWIRELARRLNRPHPWIVRRLKAAPSDVLTDTEQLAGVRFLGPQAVAWVEEQSRRLPASTVETAAGRFNGLMPRGGRHSPASAPSTLSYSPDQGGDLGKSVGRGLSDGADRTGNVRRPTAGTS